MMNKLQFNINEIGENGLHIKSEWSPNFLNDISKSLSSMENIQFNSNIFIDAYMHKDQRQIVLRGSLSLKYISPCSRCLTDVNLQINPELNLILLPKNADDFEFENDTVISSYSGTTIDITDYLSEMVSISFPVKVVCDQNCKGLCPNCGADLNIDNCNCEENRISPDFTVLKNYIN